MSFKMINKTITTEQKLAFLRREITLCMEELPYAQGTRKEYITTRLSTMARNMGELKGLTRVVTEQPLPYQLANIITVNLLKQWGADNDVFYDTGRSKAYPAQ